MSFPRATVRLQLHNGFDFDAAASTVDYYAALGISDFYLSPIFAARQGSTHGYDVIDPTQINPELGGEAGFERLVARLRAAGMGAVIDIVPNHMGIAPGANRYWQDVLAKGSASDYAHWFDIDWASPNPRLNGKILLPVLGQSYGEALAAGDVRLDFDFPSGAFQLRCYGNPLPLAHGTRQNLLAGEPLPDESGTGEVRESWRTTPESSEAIRRVLNRYDASHPAGMKALHGLLEQQHYRLTWWRNAAEDINWRRFFEVSDLAGVRVELEDVFEATHALVFDLYSRGLIDGVRVDHVDGLAEPQAYCRRLRLRLAGLQAQRQGELARTPAWIVVEKILSPGEALPEAWQVDGTTGYDFMDQAGALLHDGSCEDLLRKLWVGLTGDPRDLDQHVQEAREQLLDENFGGEFDALALALFHYQASLLPAGQDVALHAIKRVLRAFLASFRRYRTYIQANDRPADPADQAVLQTALDAALRNLRVQDHSLLRSMVSWLAEPAADTPESRDLRARAVTRFQQLTPPLAAKSIEDTAFYRFGPLLSRNDVGSYPQQSGMGPVDFHAANQRRASTFPGSMLATATHDHKRGEDVRARLAVLAEIPSVWQASIGKWMQAHNTLRPLVSLPLGALQAPARADEVMLYQTLFGAWPPMLKASDRAGVSAFADRVSAWQQKALREAKLHSSWMQPVTAYEEGCEQFLRSLLCTGKGTVFRTKLAELVQFASPAAGVNSLVQTFLRLTCPGVPDLYQGAELDDYSLVDPDNRRAVDMNRRRKALEGVDRLTSLWNESPASGSKLFVIKKALALRKSHPALFSSGAYLPLDVVGDRADHIVAFARSGPAGTLVAAAALRPFSGPGTPAGHAWANHSICLPEELQGFSLRDALWDGRTAPHGREISLEKSFRNGPVALFSTVV